MSTITLKKVTSNYLSLKADTRLGLQNDHLVPCFEYCLGAVISNSSFRALESDFRKNS